MTGATLLVLSLRLAKFLAIAAFTGGLAATFSAETPASRRRAVGLVLAPGFLATWALGFGLAFATGSPLLTPFVLLTLLASFTALQAALYYGLGEDRPRPWPLTIAALGLGASFYFMVFRAYL